MVLKQSHWPAQWLWLVGSDNDLEEKRLVFKNRISHLRIAVSVGMKSLVINIDMVVLTCATMRCWPLVIMELSTHKQEKKADIKGEVGE